MLTTDNVVALNMSDVSRFVLRNGGATSVDLRRGGVVVSSIGVESRINEIVLKYISNQSERIADTIRIAYTPRHFGGERSWFICPGCEQRKTLLFYLDHFRCRKCHGLAYESQQESREDRGSARLSARRIKLGGSGALGVPFPPKPSRMRWETYAKLREEDDQGIKRFFTAWAAVMIRLTKLYKSKGDPQP
jgi:hypothetical protein